MEKVISANLLENGRAIQVFLIGYDLFSILGRQGPMGLENNFSYLNGFTESPENHKFREARINVNRLQSLKQVTEEEAAGILSMLDSTRG